MKTRISKMNYATISLRQWVGYGVSAAIVMTSTLADEIDRSLVEAWEIEVRCHFGGPAWVTAPSPVNINWQSFSINERAVVHWDPSDPGGAQIGMYGAIKAFNSSAQLLGSTSPELNKVILAHLSARSSAYPEMLAMILCDRLGINSKHLVRKHFGTDNMHAIDRAVLKELCGKANTHE